ncbi:hypothetical protein [Tunturibacter empetritectus]|uniref:NAD-dependent epimerase/dehydratase family protein n=1 Tax=Tunturiibacter empetritectus TaxID=3069691 RepID=A0A7W8ILV1_9BACT|nr:hypothetical protein [Edaphobacter lichenicola]MBB5319507.1 hypothetical protein [Edaphobacter lichenicola]
MDTPMPNKKRLVIVGATGMVGGYALRFALEDSAVISVMAIGWHPLGISHPKLNEVIHQASAIAPGLLSRFPAKTRRSFAWERIRGRFQTRNCVKLPLITQLNLQEFST